MPRVLIIVIREANYNALTLKFDYFPEFQNVISDIPPPASVIMTHCVRKSIFDSPLSCTENLVTSAELLKLDVMSLQTFPYVVYLIQPIPVPS